MKYSELEQRLKERGCYSYRQGGNHPIWYSPITGLFFEMSHHRSQEVRPGTLKSIVKRSGVTI
jgi:predicted RNA binding protein YcfA (HicA-like mRNA interferase family)